MTRKSTKTFALVAALACAFALAGCAKKAAKVTPPPPPASTPPAPTATLAANPRVIQQGQPSLLTWQTSNANEIAIPGLGTPHASGPGRSCPAHPPPARSSPKAREERTKPPRVSRLMPQSPTSRLHPRMRNCSAATSKTFPSTSTSTSSAPMRRQPSKTTKPSWRSIRASRFSSKAIVTTVDPRNTTSPAAPAVRKP